MKSAVLLCLCSLAVVHWPSKLGAQTFYVAPTGSDTNPGTLAAPFQTLQRARDAVRSVNTSMGGDITVYLRGGRYNLTGALTLDSRDSGTNGHNVIWQAYSGETPVVMGGRVLTGWQAEGSNYKVFVGTSVYSRHLYVNGVRAIRARSNVTLSQSKWGDANGGGFDISTYNMSTWGNPSDIELINNNNWKHHRCAVASISGNRVTLDQPCWNAAQTNTPAYTMFNSVDYIENAYELLDSPGEWYLNRTTGWLYYRPRTGEDMTTAEGILPTVEQLVTGTGTATSPIANVQFKGVVFAYATWTLDDYGLSDFQGNYRWYSGASHRIAANIDFKYGRNIRFEGCYFTHLGATGLSYNIGTQNSQIVGNHFCDVSASPIYVADTANLIPPDADKVRNIQISDNYVHSVGVEYPSAVGINVGIADAVTVTHNELTDLSYTAISYGWNWWPLNSPALGNSNISANYIHDVMKVLYDGGAIYVTGAQSFGPSTVDSNYITSDRNEFGALYADQGATNFRFTNNVTFGNFRTGLFRCAQYIHNNWWNNGAACTAYPQQNCIYTYNGVPQDDRTVIGGPCAPGHDIGGNTTISDTSQAPSTITGNAGIEPAYAAIKNEPAMGNSTAAAPPVITTSSPLLPATAGKQYTQTISATGSQPITWTITSGSLPVNVTLASGTGVISGTPASAGSFTFTVQASNTAGSSTRQFLLTVGTAPAITSGSPLASGTVGAAYAQALTATGDAPITWSVAGGTLPPGLALSSSGTLSGTPSTAGSYTFTVQAANTYGAASKQLSVTIASSLSSSGTSTSGTNLASQATVTDSSENASTTQYGSKAIDGVVDGAPGDYTKEWATVGELAGAWIRLTWPSPVTLSKIVLYDRINLDDNVLAGTLSFSDNSTVAVGALPNDGTALAVSFSDRTVSWVQFHVDNAVGLNIGLAEIQAFGTVAATTSTTPALSGLQCSATTVVSGTASTCTVTLSSAAGTNGVAVSLASNISALTVPASVTVPAGATSATFAATAGDVTASQSGTVTATLAGVSQTASITVTSAGTNVALQATVTDSSENASTGQYGTKAIDGVVDGAPGDSTKEWATVGQLAGAWIRLTWANPVTISKIVLHDRINVDDNVLAGTLLFSDNSTVPVGALPNDGTGLVVTFAPKTVTWVQFRVDNAVGLNIGLAEFEVWGTIAAPAPAPAPVPALAGLQCSPTTIASGGTSACTVMLTSAALSSGVTVAVADNSTAVSVPTSVTVPAGSTTAAFNTVAGRVKVTTTATVTATLAGVSKAASITVTRR